jgi:hypothetical protein
MSLFSRWMCAAAAALALLAPSELRAQSVLDRVVRSDEFGQPVVVRHLVGIDVGKVARAAGVPLGIELLPGNAFLQPIPELTATGLTVREVFDEIQRRDGRYRWREMNGVVVLRPKAEWNRAQHLLMTPVAPLHADGIAARHALRIACASLGGPDRTLGHADTVAFDVDFTGGNALDLFNTIVRSHGRLAWAVQPSPKDEHFKLSVTIMSGTQGYGCGVPGVFRPISSVTGEQPAPSPVAVADLLDDLGRGAGGAGILERIVPTVTDLKARGMYDWVVTTLAASVRVPVVFERGLRLQPLEGDGVPLTGLTLRAALDVLIALDSRYGWREIDGVIVIRPHESWGDANHPLFRLAPAIDVGDVTIDQPVAACLRVLTRDDAYVSLGDSRHFALRTVEGPVLDLMMAVARAHGQVSWVFGPADPAEVRRGFPFHIEVRMMHGGGGGFLVR